MLHSGGTTCRLLTRLELGIFFSWKYVAGKRGVFMLGSIWAKTIKLVRLNSTQVFFVCILVYTGKIVKLTTTKSKEESLT